MMLFMFLMYMHLMKIKKNYLCYLIGLEYISSILLFFLIMNNNEIWMFMFMMIYLVCEVVIGLSLLISLNYMMGHDKIYLMMMMC
uniref:NADH dehydrogenase subunit 4L n=1 Tax=Eucera floralia TaxID=599063 RepID=A0A343DRI8_9HYME|nr:NADH dehydrogenase subunit 4L [Eucera floralia]